MEYYSQKDQEEWLLIPIPEDYRLRDGSTAYEIKFRDIPSIIEGWFFKARRFWLLYRSHGLPVADWRKMTIQQMAIIDVFDACLRLHSEESNANARYKR